MTNSEYAAVLDVVLVLCRDVGIGVLSLVASLILLAGCGAHLGCCMLMV